jgi:hypothetical protein
MQEESEDSNQIIEIMAKQIEELRGQFDVKIQKCSQDTRNLEFKIHDISKKCETKADKNAVLKSQEKFMKQMKDQNDLLDKQINMYIMEEFKRIGTKF